MRALVITALKSAGLNTPGVDAIVSRQLDENTRGWIVHAYVVKVLRRLLNSIPDTDPRQGWLALPEYADIPAAVANDSLEELRDRIRTLKRQIRSYDYDRRIEDGLKADKRRLRALQKLEANIAPYFAGDPRMTVTNAVELYENSLVEKARKAATVRWNGRTKNQ
jgi:hypothetical protein